VKLEFQLRNQLLISTWQPMVTFH